MKEDECTVAQANSKLNEDGTFTRRNRYGSSSKVITKLPITFSEFRGYYKQVVAVATACIPFLENDDSNHCLIGANMQSGYNAFD